MIRHIFIAPVKKDVSDEKVNERVEAMKLLNEKVQEIKNLTVGRTLGWYGSENAVAMVVDLEDKAGWDASLTNEYHAQLNATADEIFDTARFIGAQTEY